MEALEPKREIRRSLKRPRPADSSHNDPETSSQASEALATEDHMCATKSGSNSSPPLIPGTETTPRMKKKRTDNEISEIVKPRSPSTVAIAPIKTPSYERRLNAMRHSDERHSARASAKAKPIGHSTPEPTPLHLATPESRMSHSTAGNTTRSKDCEQLVQPLKERGPLQRSRTEGGNKKTSKGSPTKAAQEPEGSE